MSFTITAPSKTFLVGEYVALTGGPTLVLNSTPRFELKMTLQNLQSAIVANGINRESPAGKLLQQNSNDFIQYQLQFLDPHQSAGGFGASSAQFLMVAIAQQLINSNDIQKLITQNKNKTSNDLLNIHQDKNIDTDNKPLLVHDNKVIILNSETLLALYQQYAWSGQGSAPSGVDVIAQCTGGLTYYHRSAQQLEQLTWPFKDIDFCLIRTGQKVATHQHLTELPAVNPQALAEIVTQTYQSLIDKNSAQFVASITHYAASLQKQQLVAAPTLDILQTLATVPSIIASKGCGALGADVILAIFETQQRNAVLNSLKQQQITPVICGHEQMSQGCTVHCLSQFKLIYRSHL